MSDILTKDEVAQLGVLLGKIKLDLPYDGIPSRTIRLELVENMKKILELHDYVITEKSKEKTVVADARDQHLINQNFKRMVG